MDDSIYRNLPGDPSPGVVAHPRRRARPICPEGQCTLCDARRRLPEAEGWPDSDEHRTGGPHKEARVALTSLRRGPDGKVRTRNHTLPLTACGDIVAGAFTNPAILSITIEWDSQINTYRFR